MINNLMTLLVIIFVLGCEGDRGSSPAEPEILEFGTGDAVPVNPVDQELPDVPIDDQGPDPESEGNNADNPPAEVLLLQVASLDQLPQRVAECVRQGVAGEVVNGMFTCNQRQLIDCNSLSEPQKQVAKIYADEQLPGYLLYGCSNSVEEIPNLHYFMVDGVALRIFNLEVQRSVGGGI